MVSSRQIGCIDAEHLATDDFVVSRWNEATQSWDEATWEQLRAGEQATKWSAVYVHGNRIEPGEDTHHGWRWYEVLSESASTLPPLQFVIWSWPSSQIRGQFKDVRMKYARAQYEADYLGWYLVRSDRTRPTMMIGFSFGGLIVPGALEYVVQSEQVTESDSASRTPRPWSAMLVAPAEPVGWLQPGGIHGEAFSVLTHADVLVNPCDRALRRFALVDKCSRPAAVGYAGLATSAFSAEIQARIDVRNASGIVGKLHDERAYRSSSTVGTWLSEAASGIVERTADHR